MLFYCTHGNDGSFVQEGRFTCLGPGELFPAQRLAVAAEFFGGGEQFRGKFRNFQV